MSKRDIQKLLEEKPELKDKLFARGFLLTSAEIDENEYPFYGIWTKTAINEQLMVMSAPNQHVYIACNEVSGVVLIGHAYNPYTMTVDENLIVKDLLKSRKDIFAFEDLLNRLTGVFAIVIVEEGKIEIYGDCAGMQAVYYGVINSQVYISSHMQLVGDICSLKRAEYIERLINYKLYRLYGAYLPGNLSVFDEVKRLTPNTKAQYDNGRFFVERIFPREPLKLISGESEYEQRIREISDVLKRNMLLIAKKWRNPAISMTGGMDSKATVAAANGLYNQFSYFSYESMYGEQIDAEAAHNIAKAIGVEHRIDKIPTEVNGYTEIKTLLEHNGGYIGKNNPNDIRKRIYYLENKLFDIEVKSWVSEIGRANYYKKFGRKKMPQKLLARHMSSLYKVFLFDRKLLRETDRVFDKYISETDARNIFNYDPSDMFLWEVRYGSWGGHVITDEHKISFDITVPYNNRSLMQLFLSLPLKRRITDQVHRDIIRCLNESVAETGIEVTNYNETKKRMIIEKMYFFINTHIPF